MKTSVITRRSLLRSAAAVACARAVSGAARKAQIGVTDWNLRLGAKPEAVALAAQLGFDGIQISFGRQLADGKMPVDDPATVSRYLDASRASGIPIISTCVDRLHDNGLKDDPEAAKWVRDSIRLTKALGTSILLLPFFGRHAVNNRDEMNSTGDALRELAPEAEKAGVILALENTLSAEDNVRVMERSRSKNVLVYYDVGNSTAAGFDVVKEIRWLGKDRMCQIHFKDGPNYLGEGKIVFPSVAAALREIGYSGWIVLETDTRRGSTLDGDMRRNLGYTRGLMAGG
jgi:sugar phosphate isomerase/epimerase